MINKKIIYVDMDHTLYDFSASYLKYKEDFPQVEYSHSISGFFTGLVPMKHRYLSDMVRSIIFSVLENLNELASDLTLVLVDREHRPLTV
jgi:hypothetical protein